MDEELFRFGAWHISSGARGKPILRDRRQNHLSEHTDLSGRPLYIFEDDDYGNFYPLTINRAVYQLRLGIDLLFEKWAVCFPDSDMLFCIRQPLADLTTLRTEVQCNRFSGIADTGAIFVNGRFIPDGRLGDEIVGDGSAELALCDGNLVSACIPPGTEEARNLELMSYWGYGHFKAIIGKLPRREVEARELKHIWDFVRLNSEQIALDFPRYAAAAGSDPVSPDARVEEACLIHGGEDVIIGPRASVDGQVVIDARGGPVYIDSDAVVQPHTRIEGPCYVGKSTMIVGGKIREGCSIGPVCKVGGELEETVILGFSNKFHDGFMGHSLIGEWVNLGAMTTNSDLKNNYSSVRVDRGDGQVDTGMIKVGSFIGDHVKTGIGTMLNTGITVGFATNLLGSTLVADKFVPPFCWGGRGSYVEHGLHRAVAVARKVFERRGVEFNELDQRLFESIFADTKAQRERLLGAVRG